jgi:death-on-curing protein
MKPIKFLGIEEVFRLHYKQIELYGGSHGIRDEGLLRSALAQPEASFEGKYVHRDLFEMASAFLYHLVQNHPFQDGNKRIGAICAAYFLWINGYQVVASEDDFENLVMQTAQSKRSKAEIAEFFKNNSVLCR